MNPVTLPNISPITKPLNPVLVQQRPMQTAITYGGTPCFGKIPTGVKFKLPRFRHFVKRCQQTITHAFQKLLSAIKDTAWKYIHPEGIAKRKRKLINTVEVSIKNNIQSKQSIGLYQRKGSNTIYACDPTKPFRQNDIGQLRFTHQTHNNQPYLKIELLDTTAGNATYKGVGKALMEAIETYAKQNHYTRIALTADPKVGINAAKVYNHPATFYKKLGYVGQFERDRKILDALAPGARLSDDYSAVSIFMEKHLTP